MALDTRDRRASALGLALPMGGVLPFRDGTVSNDDFEQVVWMYRGIQAALPPVMFDVLLVMHRTFMGHLE